ncbi:MAG TPA: ATP-binding protein [Candidatus Coprovivens excrementavium]|nr:ATP-binding protein [Candidatus Coprovivens excrementavium]
MKYSSEIYLTKNHVTQNEWQEFIKYISKYNGILKKWTITISIEGQEIRYHLHTNFKVPSSISNLSSFLLKEEPNYNIKHQYISLPTLYPIGSNIIDCLNYSQIKRLGTLKYITIIFKKITSEKIISKVYLYLENNHKIIKTKMILGLPSNLLSFDFSQNKLYSYKKIPKYFDITKLTNYLTSTSNNSSLLVDTFPYLEGPNYLKTFDYNKHTLIIGSSGTGKSKYISSFINNLYNIDSKSYRLIMIDPHASIENDIGGIGKVIDFNQIEDSLNLFSSSNQDLISNTELILELFKSIINDQYNSKLERILRHSIYLLLASNNFNFNTLRKLLLETEFRLSLVKKQSTNLPSSISDFFLTDFNEIKTKSYNEAISPIISFIDEMEMIPVLNNENIPFTLENTIKDNFLTLISLDKTKLGDKALKTISGLIMQQLFTLVQKHSFKEHLIFIIDEVAIIENPILCRFLSETRKYNLSLILAGQYFNQISSSLKDAIFANVINYFLFRLSQNDARLIVDNLSIKIPQLSQKTLAEQKEEKINLLSNLNNRECIVRISINNKLIPSFKAKTTDYISNPRLKKISLTSHSPISIKKQPSNITFNIDNIKIHDILSSNSSSRG